MSGLVPYLVEGAANAECGGLLLPKDARDADPLLTGTFERVPPAACAGCSKAASGGAHKVWRAIRYAGSLGELQAAMTQSHRAQAQSLGREAATILLMDRCTHGLWETNAANYCPGGAPPSVAAGSWYVSGGAGTTLTLYGDASSPDPRHLAGIGALSPGGLVRLSGCALASHAGFTVTKVNAAGYGEALSFSAEVLPAIDAYALTPTGAGAPVATFHLYPPGWSLELWTTVRQHYPRWRKRVGGLWVDTTAEDPEALCVGQDRCDHSRPDPSGSWGVADPVYGGVFHCALRHELKGAGLTTFIDGYVPACMQTACPYFTQSASNVTKIHDALARQMLCHPWRDYQLDGGGDYTADRGPAPLVGCPSPCSLRGGWRDTHLTWGDNRRYNSLGMTGGWKTRYTYPDPVSGKTLMGLRGGFETLRGSGEAGPAGTVKVGAITETGAAADAAGDPRALVARSCHNGHLGAHLDTASVSGRWGGGTRYREAVLYFPRTAATDGLQTYDDGTVQYGSWDEDFQPVAEGPLTVWRTRLRLHAGWRAHKTGAAPARYVRTLTPAELLDLGNGTVNVWFENDPVSFTSILPAQQANWTSEFRCPGTVCPLPEQLRPSNKAASNAEAGAGGGDGYLREDMVLEIPDHASVSPRYRGRRFRVAAVNAAEGISSGWLNPTPAPGWDLAADQAWESTYVSGHDGLPEDFAVWCRWRDMALMEDDGTGDLAPALAEAIALGLQLAAYKKARCKSVGTPFYAGPETSDTAISGALALAAAGEVWLPTRHDGDCLGLPCQLADDYGLPSVTNDLNSRNAVLEAILAAGFEWSTHPVGAADAGLYTLTVIPDHDQEAEALSYSGGTWSWAEAGYAYLLTRGEAPAAPEQAGAYWESPDWWKGTFKNAAEPFRSDELDTLPWPGAVADSMGNMVVDTPTHQTQTVEYFFTDDPAVAAAADYQVGTGQPYGSGKSIWCYTVATSTAADTLQIGLAGVNYDAEGEPIVALLAAAGAHDGSGDLQAVDATAVAQAYAANATRFSAFQWWTRPGDAAWSPDALPGPELLQDLFHACCDDSGLTWEQLVEDGPHWKVGSVTFKSVSWLSSGLALKHAALAPGDCPLPEDFQGAPVVAPRQD